MKKTIQHLYVEGTENMLNAFNAGGVTFRVYPQELADNFPLVVEKNRGKLFPNARNLFVHRAPVTITEHDPSAETVAAALQGEPTVAFITIKPHTEGKAINVHINRRVGTPTHHLTKDPNALAEGKNTFQVGGVCTRWTFLPL